MHTSFTPVLPGSLPDADENAGVRNSQSQFSPEPSAVDLLSTAGTSMPVRSHHFQDALRQLLRAHEDEVSELQLELARLRSCSKNCGSKVEHLHPSSKCATREVWASPSPRDRDRLAAKGKTLGFANGEAESVTLLLEHNGMESDDSLVSTFATANIQDELEGNFSRSDTKSDTGQRESFTSEYETPRPRSIRNSNTMPLELHAVGGGGRWLHNWINLLNRLFQYALQNTSHLHEIWVMSDSYLRKVAATNDNVDLWHTACEKKRSMRRGRANSGSQVISRTSIEQGRISTTNIGVGDLIFDKQWVWMELKFRLQLLRHAGLVAFLEHYLVVAPHARIRLFWVSVGMFLMFYDVIVLPLQAFDYAEDDGMMNFMKWFQAVFWTLDLVFTFFTAIYVDVEIVLKLKVIARHYAKSWLLFDLAVLIPVWVEQLLSKGSNLGAAKLVRMMRFLRLVRLAKFDLLLGESLKAIDSPSVVLLFKLLQLILGLVVFVHMNACVWYLVGKQQDGWTVQVANDSVSYKYLTSVHWALTQFQGTSEINPGRYTGERAYAASVVLISMIIAAAFLSNFTNIVMQIQALTVDRDRQIHDLCFYMRANRISRPLSMRARTYLLWKSQKEKHRACEVLKALPTPLVMELEFETYQPVLQHHDFLSEFICVYPRLSQRVFHEYMKPVYISPTDLVFSAQETCFSVYFVVSGILDYAVIIRRQHEALTLGRERVGPGATLSEAALWMQWQHKGTLVAESYSNLLVLASEGWRNMVATHPPALLSCNLYARRLIAGMARHYWKCTDLLNPALLIVEDKSFLDCLASVTLS